MIAGFRGFFCMIAGALWVTSGYPQSDAFLRDSRYPADPSGGGGYQQCTKLIKKRFLSTAYALMYDFRICVIAGFSGVFCVTIRTYCGLRSAFRTTSCVPCLLSATSPSASASCARRTSHGRMFSFCPERCGSLARRRFPPLA